MYGSALGCWLQGGWLSEDGSESECPFLMSHWCYIVYTNIYVCPWILCGTCLNKWCQSSEHFPERVFATQMRYNWKASSKNWKASWEQHWVCTHISFRTAVQLHLWIFLSVFQSSVCVFQNLIFSRNVAQPWKLFPQVRVKFKDTYHTHATATCLSKLLMESLLATT